MVFGGREKGFFLVHSYEMGYYGSHFGHFSVFVFFFFSVHHCFAMQAPRPG